MNLIKKFAVGIVGGFLLMGTSPVFAAEIAAEISGNGADSFNKIEIVNTCTSVLDQTNKTKVGVNVDVYQNTGNNEANKNTGGDVEIKTGDATSTVDVTVGGSSNEANGQNCCCGENGNVVALSINGNGFDSTNKVKSTNTTTQVQTQKNKKKVRVNVSKKQKTGFNEANKNTGGSSSTDTGSTDSTVSVDVTGDSNSL